MARVVIRDVDWGLAPDAYSGEVEVDCAEITILSAPNTHCTILGASYSESGLLLYIQPIKQTAESVEEAVDGSAGDTTP